LYLDVVCFGSAKGISMNDANHRKTIPLRT
jgi:hypothetical protein